MSVEERTKAEHDGVDVAALLKVSNSIEYEANFGGRALAEIPPAQLLLWTYIIRDAVNGANPSKSRELPEGVIIPLDADGQPCHLDDAVWHKGCMHLVVAVSHKGKVCIRDWETRDSGKGAVWVKAEYVTHRKPDSMEAIRDDATMPAATYCVRHGLVDSDTDVCESTLLERHILHLLERQRKLLGGE